MKKTLKVIGVISAGVIVGVLTAVIFKALGAPDFTAGQWMGVFSTMTYYNLLPYLNEA